MWFKRSEVEIWLENIERKELCLSNKTDTINILHIWEDAISQYEQRRQTRANDALGRRMRLLLKKIGGVPFSEIDPTNTNLSRDLSNALKDAVKLKKLYPHLPELKNMTAN